MATYTINNQEYYFKDEISQEEAEKRIAERSAPVAEPGNSDSYEGFFTEAGEGVASGVIGIGEGLVTTGTLAFDLLAGTDSTEVVEKWVDEFKENNGIDPEGAAGLVTEALVQYGLPGFGVASAVGKAGRVARIASGKSRIGVKSVGKKDARVLGTKYGDVSRGRASALTKSQRAGLAARQISAAGLADAIVSTDGTQTLGDFFEVGPTETVDAVGLEGRDKAFEKIKNKLKIGLEGGIATGVIPPALGASLKAITTVGAIRPVTALGSDFTVLDIASGFTLPAAKKSIEVIGKGIKSKKDKILTENPELLSTLDKVVGNAASLLTYGGFLDPLVARAKSLVNPEIEGVVKRATQDIKEIDKQIKKTLKKTGYGNIPEYNKKKLVDNFMDVLNGADEATLGLPKELEVLYGSAKTRINRLSEDIKKTGAYKALPDEATGSRMTKAKFDAILNKNIEEGGYLRRLYRIFNDADYVLKADEKKHIVDVLLGGDRNNMSLGHIRGVLSNSAVAIDDAQMESLTKGQSKLTRRQAEEYVDRYVAINKQKKNRAGGGSAGRIFNVRLDTSLIAKRKVDSKVQRLILGEVEDPREAYVATVAELSNFVAADKFLNTFKASADANIAGTLARNAENIANNVLDASGKVVQEKQLFYNIEDEILKILKKEKYADSEDIIDPALAQDLTSISKLDDQTIKKALKLWNDNNTGYEILGRTIGTAGDRANEAGATAVESVYGTMFGYAIPKAMFNNLSSKVYTDEDMFPTMLRQIYAPMMKLKGISQYTKTILSPITQVRNVTSAAMFALANGNFGKGASLGTSVNVVLKDIIDKELQLGGKTFDSMKLDGETLDFLTDLQRRGVIGSSAQLREIQDNLRKGLGYDRETQDYAVRSMQGEDLGAYRNPEFKITETSKLKKFWKVATKPLDVAENLYRGGDDIWKIYNYTFEMNKFRNVRRKMQNAEINKIKQGSLYKSLDGNNEAQLKLVGDATRLADQNFGRFINAGDNVEPKLMDERLRQYAADNVRNLVPNYELVPEAITGLRGLPFGDFIAFPAEILRTGFNTLDVSLKELGSNDAAIREVGVRRLMGATTAFGTLGVGLQEFGKFMSDMSTEDLDAINRSAAPYQRNAQFIPVGTDDKGNPEVMDFSHTNPYDMLSRPFHTVLRGLREGAKLDKGSIENVSDAVFSAIGEFIEPFAGVSMVYESMLDVMPIKTGLGRGGKTPSGAEVYDQNDTLGRKAEKSIIHLLDTLRPNMIPLRVPVGADLGIADFTFTPIKSPEVSRFVRGTFMEPGSIEPTTGRKYTAGGEIFRALTGLNTQIIDRDKVLKFKALQFKSNRSGSATLFNDVFKLDSPSTATFLEGYARADNARLKTFRQFKVHVDDMKLLGLDEAKIRRILRDNKLGRKEISAILNDTYRSFRPSKELRKEAIKRGVDYPFSEINELIQERDFIPITPPKVKEEIPDPLDLSTLNISPSNTNTQPAPQPVAQTNNVDMDIDNVLRNALNIQTNPVTRTSPTVLGSDPTSVAKNMDIARRTA